MTQFQDIRPGSVAIPTRQVVNKAGEISSTVEDVSSWPVENGLNIKDGKLALSTSSSTTVTNAENLYPALWANSPTAWKSGSDLVVPPQGVPAGLVDVDSSFFDITLNSGAPAGWYVNRSSLDIKRSGNTLYLNGQIKLGDSTGNYNTPSGAGIGFGFSKDVYAFGSAIGFYYVPGVDEQGHTREQVAAYYSGNQYPAVINEIPNVVVIGDDTPDTYIRYFEVTGETQFVFNNLKIELANPIVDETPLIYLFDNVTSSSIGLPEIGAEQPGLPTLDQIAEGNRNYIYNGGDFWQRGTSFSNITNDAYTADRWKGRRASNALGMEVFKSTVVKPNAVLDSSITIKRGTTTTEAMRICQQIESHSCRELAGKIVTFALDYSSALGAGYVSAKIEIRYSTVLDESLGVFSGTLVAEKNIPIVNDDSWKREGITFTLPSDCLAMIVVIEVQPSGTDISSDFFRIMEPKLEQGTQATKFTRAGVTYAGELALCQRYYLNYGQRGAGAIVPFYGYRSSSVNIYGTFITPVTMRTSPTISDSSNLSIFYSDETSTPSSITFTTIGQPSGSLIPVKIQVPSSNGNIFVGRVSSGLIELNAEL